MAGRGIAEAFPPSFGGGYGRKLGRVCPAADGEEGFEVAVLLLEQVELLDAAVGVFPCVVPRVGRVVLFEVGVGVG